MMMQVMDRLEFNQKAFGEYPKSQLAESLGVLPFWVMGYRQENGTLVEHMEQSYGFGSLYKFDGQVLPDGTYRSPYKDDTDLPYIAKMETVHGTVYFYEYAMLALPTTDGYFITRMD